MTIDGATGEFSLDFDVLDLCDSSLIKHCTLQEAIGHFRTVWGRVPGAVAVPIVGSGGTAIAVPGVPYVPFTYGGSLLSLPTLLSMIHEETGLERMFLVMKPDFGGDVSGIPWLEIEDIVGDSSRRLCFGNPQVHGLLGQIVVNSLEALDPQQRGWILGLVVDAVNLWPMSASEGKIKPTCFCPHCRQFLRSRGVDTRKFETFPSPWNLALKDRGSGLGCISDLEWDTDDAEVVRLARNKGFSPRNETATDGAPDLLVHARDLRTYMRARHEQTVAGLAHLYEAMHRVLPNGMRAVIIESESYGWTSGLFRDRLDTEGVVDEVWTNPGHHLYVPAQPRVRYFMWRRARYFIDAFFDAYESVGDRAVTVGTGVGERNLLALLSLRWAQMMAASFGGHAALTHLPPNAQMRGIIGPSIGDEYIRRVINSVNRAESIASLREEAGEEARRY